MTCPKLFIFKKRQQIVEIGNCKIGGQPGELPTVLIGNVFYKGMPEVRDHKKGRFDKKKLLHWIELAETFSAKSGVPHFLDLMAMYPEAMTEYVAFVSEHTDTPFLVDGANPETRKAALSIVKQLGLEHRVVFNGLTPTTSRDELETLKQSRLNAAVLMAFNEYDYSPKGRMKILKGFAEHEGLLQVAKKAGLEKILIDTIVFDVPSISFAAESIKLVKEKTGYPAGCSPANATYYWKQTLKDSILSEGFKASNVSAHTLAQCWGADFLIYGPIKQAKNMICATAISDSIITYYAMKRCGIKPLVKTHPLNTIF